MKLEWLNVSIHARNKNKRLKDKRITILNKVCGCATQGLTAVMGPSGCGKTTLISTLAGRVPSSTKTSGCVLYNEEERNLSVWMNSVGFVDQDDTFFEGLTAYETVYYAARFKLKGKNVNIETKIAKLFVKLRITHIINCQMRVISGGERKRVMIAVELVSDPQIVFLDEPTSGLDNDVAFSIMELLKEVAQEGKIVILSIHQPDDRLSLLLDKIILMSRGEIIATGTMQECKEYLMHNGYEQRDNTTFSSFAMEILGNSSLKYNESGKDCKLEKLASSYRNQFVYDKKYQNTRVGSDFSVKCTPNLMDIGVLINRRMKLGVFRVKTFIVYAIIVAIMVAIFSFGVMDDLVLKAPDKSAGVSDDILAVERIRNWFNLVVVFDIGEILVIIIAFTLNSVFNSEQRNIRREVSAYSYTIVSYHLSVLVFELIYHLPLVTCYLCATLYKYTPKQGIGFVIGCQLLRYWVIMNFGFVLISIFGGYKASVMCFIAGMLFYYLAPRLSTSYLLLPDKSVSPEHLSKIISALSMFPSSFLHAYVAMFFSERLFEAESQKRIMDIPFVLVKKPPKYFKLMNLVYLPKYACLAIAIISSFVFLLLGIIFHLRVLSPKTRLRLYGSK